MAHASALLNVMIAAARKTARTLSRDFGEVEALQVSRKGAADFVSAADLRAMAATMADYLRRDDVSLPDRWQAATAFTPVRPVRNRHRCVTLPFEAALAALDDAGA